MIPAEYQARKRRFAARWIVLRTVSQRALLHLQCVSAALFIA